MSDLQNRLATSLSGTYSLERELGGGGMSRVFVAEETALGRKVVVKVLSPELAQGLSGERFIREIKVAARLQQANIVPVLRAGELDGLPYYTMPFVAGETLRARMLSAPMATSDALAILRDVAKALAYAHAEGVVHRDIKPENVLLSAGTAVVTDFGIAKAVAAAKRGDRSDGDAPKDPLISGLTVIGSSLGTPAYMAPEQAAGDPNTDARADLYAWGVMAYELLSGRHPFAHHRGVHELIRAHMMEMPENLGARGPAVPIQISNLIMRTLAKAATDRPASASEILAELDAVHANPGVVRPALGAGKALAIYAAVFLVVAVLMKVSTTLIGLPSWAFGASLGVMALGLPVVLLTALIERQRSAHVTVTPNSMSTMTRIAVAYPKRFTWKHTTIGGAMAFGALALSVAAYLAMRQFGIGPFGTLIGSKALTANDRIVIADLRGPATDSSLGAVFAEGLRAGLGESRALRLVSAERVKMLLAQMQKPTESVVGDVAREVAVRAGAKAILDGDVQRVGTSYALTVRLLRATGGEPMLTLQETANGDADFTAAAGRLSKRVRERIGESLRSLNSAPELEAVTTTSLVALRKYTEATLASGRGDYAAVFRLANEAIAADSGFASAYALIGGTLPQVTGTRQVQSEALERAYAMRSRATGFEQHLIEARYWMAGPNPDYAKANTAAEAAYAISPERAAQAAAQTNFALRDYARAVRMAHEAVEADSSRIETLYNLTVAQSELGQVDSARATLQKMLTVFPGHPDGMVLAAELASLDGKDSVAMSIALGLQRMTSIPLLVEWGAGIQSAVARKTGRLREHWRALSVRERAAQSRGQRSAAGSALMLQIQDLAKFLNDTAGARHLMDSLTRTYPPERLPPRERFDADYLDAAAASGNLAELRRGVEAIRRDDPNRRTTLGTPMLPAYEARLAFAEHRYADALAAVRRANAGGGSRDGLFELASTFDAIGQVDSALVYYERFLTSPSLDLSLWIEGCCLATARARLGEIYEARSEPDKAYSMYAALVDQWRNADPELQPKIAEMRLRMKGLNAKRTR